MAKFVPSGIVTVQAEKPDLIHTGKNHPDDPAFRIEQGTPAVARVGLRGNPEMSVIFVRSNGGRNYAFCDAQSVAEVARDRITHHIGFLARFHRIRGSDLKPRVRFGGLFGRLVKADQGQIVVPVEAEHLAFGCPPVPEGHLDLFCAGRYVVICDHDRQFTDEKARTTPS